METITVVKSDLIATIQKNRDEHRAQFLTAQERYRERMIEELDHRLAEVRAGKKIDRAFRLPEPVDYTSSYDTALKMLAWEINDEIELDKRSFEELVLNQWGWVENYRNTTGTYLVS